MQFSDLTVSAQLNRAGAWMGLSFGDINADGHLDLFGSSLGDRATTLFTSLDPVYGALVNTGSRKALLVGNLFSSRQRRLSRSQLK